MSDKEFTLKYEFEDVGKLRDGRELFSPEEDHLGMKWRITIQKSSDFLRMYFSACFGDGEMHVDYTKRIFSKNKQKIYSISGSKVFGKHASVLCPFIDWKTMEKEYLADGKLDAEIHLKITKIIGFEMYLVPMVRAPMGNCTPKIAFQRKELRSFGEEMKQFSDVVLKVKDRKFNVSKLTLSSHSPYFANLFLGQLEESEKSEIELKDVNPQDFQYFLEVLYAEDAIDDDNVRGILQIAESYQTPLAIKKCENYLIEKSKMELKKKLELAGKYKLEEKISNSS